MSLAQNGLLKKVKDFFILEAEEGEFEEIEQEEVQEQESGKVLHINKSRNRSGVTISDPKSSEDVKKVAQDLKDGRIVLVNITHMEKEMAMEFLNFMSGAAYAVNGSYKKVGHGVFLFTPTGVPISELQDIMDEPEKKEEDILMFKDI